MYYVTSKSVKAQQKSLHSKNEIKWQFLQNSLNHKILFKDVAYSWLQNEASAYVSEKTIAK